MGYSRGRKARDSIQKTEEWLYCLSCLRVLADPSSRHFKTRCRNSFNIPRNSSEECGKSSAEMRSHICSQSSSLLVHPIDYTTPPLMSQRTWPHRGIGSRRPRGLGDIGFLFRQVKYATRRNCQDAQKVIYEELQRKQFFNSHVKIDREIDKHHWCEWRDHKIILFC